MRGNTGRRIGRLVAAVSIAAGAALLVGGMAGRTASPNDANWVHADANWLHSSPTAPQAKRVLADANWLHVVVPDDANWLN